MPGVVKDLCTALSTRAPERNFLCFQTPGFARRRLRVILFSLPCTGAVLDFMIRRRH
jgi:hypothetical protein